MQIFHPDKNIEYFHNRGCGISYLQRNNKISYSQVPEDSWFLREHLTNQIAFDIPWCLLEPEEGRYDWENSEWEGNFQSWIDAGYKVHLKVRGMDTLGTLYNEGTPQWVFDAGAKYIDDPISIYRREKILLNNIPVDAILPIRYPVYWDPIYIEKAERFIHGFGKRYNGHPALETVSIAFMGRWGEMHIGDWGPMEPWLEAGFTIPTYIKTLIHFIDIYRAAFPDTQLSLSIGRPALYPEYKYDDVMEVFDYAAENGIMLKYDGLGNSFEPGSSPYICKSVSDIYKKNIYRTKLAFENLVLPEALDDGIIKGISYWQRGGESGGLGISRIDQNIPVFEKRIFSWYGAFSPRYDMLTIEQQKDCFRKMARKCGYRLGLDSISLEDEIMPGQPFISKFKWNNLGNAPCYEKFKVKLALFDPVQGQDAWCNIQAPQKACSPSVWDAGKIINDELIWHLPPEISSGRYELRVGIQMDAYNQEMMQLVLSNQCLDGMYNIANIKVKNRVQSLTYA